MLLTDGNPNTTEDLRTYESAILSVANTESIDLSVKLGLATEEITQDVVDFLLNRSNGNDPQGAARRSVGVSDVVVTKQMKRWHALHTLAIAYRDAFNNQLNDRYEAKFQEYRAVAVQARSLTLQFGVGLVYKPLPQATSPSFGFAPGPFESTTYFVQVAWVSTTGQEGLASNVITYDAAAGTVPVVTTRNAPQGVTGFDVYMGLSPETLAKQNDAPIALTDAFTLAETGLIHGEAPSEGQTPDFYVAATNTLRRG
jgi:hypothetical protein